MKRGADAQRAGQADAAERGGGGPGRGDGAARRDSALHAALVSSPPVTETVRGSRARNGS
eukprot:CAMPEP_0176300986 /NCGR_PEP_ID=MMETSP0121_2-20121125/60619_1 /TAXON_ID=160619 /ORGANISM="Kryptoperidinium foliaceum, Strain CCMP 1326" /LENGTH=59 /DNA_ID=CAMNT_0017642421 /DNA_START=219 /DNA_END=398 /DNA_ORIENTATION=+